MIYLSLILSKEYVSFRITFGGKRIDTLHRFCHGDLAKALVILPFLRKTVC